MPRSLHEATKSKKRGRSSIQSKKRGTQRKMPRSCTSIPPVHGDRKLLMICSPATDARGEDCNELETRGYTRNSADDCGLPPGSDPFQKDHGRWTVAYALEYFLAPQRGVVRTCRFRRSEERRVGKECRSR